MTFSMYGTVSSYNDKRIIAPVELKHNCRELKDNKNSSIIRKKRGIRGLVKIKRKDIKKNRKEISR